MKQLNGMEQSAEKKTSKINDGGPAFPVFLHPGELFASMGKADGMTLRDWFAGQALASGTYTGSDDVWASEQCYIIADAMIAERNGQ